MEPMDTYSKMIDLAEPALDALLAEAGLATPCERQRAVDGVVGLVRGCTYVNALGRQPLDAVARLRTGNCLSLVCLSVSMLRRAGLSSDEVFAVIASPRHLYPSVVHTYVALPLVAAGSIEWIDPEGMCRYMTSIPALFTRFILFVAFNDAVQAVKRTEVCRLLGGAAGDIPPTGVGAAAPPPLHLDAAKQTGDADPAAALRQ